jgi:hypothetical protein
MTLPAVGIDAETVLETVKDLHRSDPYESPDGKSWGGVYHDHNHHPKLQDLQANVWRDYNASNALYPGSWPSLQKYEAELVRMVIDLLNGDENACGLLASGGTESILMAALGYRELAKQRGIENPEILCGATAHGAIHKACHYFGIKLKVLPIDPVTMQLTASIVAQNLTKETIAIYASAPNFAHGVIDDITGLGILAEQHGVGLHVDNCLGGILLSFMRQNGELRTKPFDFQIPGVSSMSCDIHKYGYASKGASVVAFRSKELRRLTWYPVVNISGGFYVTPTLQGARNGANIAQVNLPLSLSSSSSSSSSSAHTHTHVPVHATTNHQPPTDTITTQLEVDLQLGLDGSTAAVYLCHPPATRSDITILQLLHQLHLSNQEQPVGAARKGLKLDFKDPAAVAPTIAALAATTPPDGRWGNAPTPLPSATTTLPATATITPPTTATTVVSTRVWLNADVLQGPGGGAAKFDADEFVQESLAVAGAELSLGWTTGHSAVDHEGYVAAAANGAGGICRYTAEHVDEMLALCSRHGLHSSSSTRTHTTFAVDAARGWLSSVEMQRLLDASPLYTLTIWGATNGAIDEWIQTFAAKNIAAGTGAGAGGGCGGDGVGFVGAESCRVFVDTHPGDGMFAARLARTVK